MHLSIMTFSRPGLETMRLSHLLGPPPPTPSPSIVVQQQQHHPTLSILAIALGWTFRLVGDRNPGAQLGPFRSSPALLSLRTWVFEVPPRYTPDHRAIPS